MKLIESEIQIKVEAKICGCNTKQKSISYHFAEPAHRLFLEKREIMLAQIQECEILLKNSNEEATDLAIRSEIVDLTIGLAATRANRNSKIVYCSSQGCINKAVIICSVCFDFYSCGYEHAYLHKHPLNEFKVLA